MPAQALIRNFDRAEVERRIVEAKATDLLMVQDYKGTPLLCCKDARPEALEALQAIADADSKITLARADELEREATVAPSPSPSPSPSRSSSSPSSPPRSSRPAPPARRR